MFALDSPYIKSFLIPRFFFVCTEKRRIFLLIFAHLVFSQRVGKIKMNLLPFMLLLKELFFVFAQLHFLLVFSLALDMRRCRQERQILSFSKCVEWVGIHWRCVFETFILCVQTFSFFFSLVLWDYKSKWKKNHLNISHKIL